MGLETSQSNINNNNSHNNQKRLSEFIKENNKTGKNESNSI